jgi:hypothetical protein
MNHIEWQAQVVDLMHHLGYTHLHVRRTIGKAGRWTTSTNLKGFPDLLGWAPSRGFVAIELKIKPDKATPEQLEVLASLAAAGARTMVAYPDQLDEVLVLLNPKRLASTP